MKLKMVSGAAELQVSEATFGSEFNESLVHQVVTAYRAAGRAGTKAQKSRAEVSGGGRKPWSQKGTGPGARRLEPLAHLGGRRRDLRGQAARFRAEGEPQDVPRRDCAPCCRSWRAQERLVVTDALALEAPKTKLLAGQLKAWSLESVLIVVEATDEKLFLAARNLPHVEVIEVSAAQPAVPGAPRPRC